jgi:hypothetical protein
MKRYALLVALLVMLWGTEAMAVTIGFDSLSGSNQSPFTSFYMEDGYKVTPTGGNWFVAKVFGNAIPAIYAGPINTPGVSQITVTEGGAQFTFQGIDLTSNSAIGTSYVIQGFLGGLGGTLVFSPPPIVISSINTFEPRLFASGSVDLLTITGNPGQGLGVTSFNIDNIRVGAGDVNGNLPEPAPIMLLGAGLAGIGLWRRQSAR